ncbi:DUF6941 family protein [Thalassoglobus polymorphus]|uniref:Uncharacterized protein n=1 Tax=Thalassoglobus polymorphus TaxID=2527994 RepID=A0A517QTX1_9PLAN|nr:hypothetical protein [Thalassoglobus polymorphus]QDT35083.1 hypothetical protein Mal48_43580 [Thalassoglobus polymorphus]
MQAITPYPLALVVADYVHRDPSTGKMTIIGTFSMIGGAEFPLVHPVMAVYAALTDGRGKMKVKLELIDVDEEREPIFSQEVEADFVDPRMILEINFHATNLQFVHSGEYRLQLSANEEFLVERRIIVLENDK